MAGTPAVETADGPMPKKMAPIFAKSPAAEKLTRGEELRARAKSDDVKQAAPARHVRQVFDEIKQMLAGDSLESQAANPRHNTDSDGASTPSETSDCCGPVQKTTHTFHTRNSHPITR